MSLFTQVRKLVRLIVRMGHAQRELAARLDALENRIAGYDSKRDAMAVPPGSTMFAGSDVRMFRVTVDGVGSVTAKLQTIDSTGALIDDTEDTANYTLTKSDEGIGYDEHDILAASFEGLNASDNAVWVIVAGGAASGLPSGTGQYKVLQLNGDDEPVWDWVRAH